MRKNTAHPIGVQILKFTTDTDTGSWRQTTGLDHLESLEVLGAVEHTVECEDCIACGDEPDDEGSGSVEQD